MRPTSANSGLRGPPLNLCGIIQRGYLPQVHLLVDLGANLEARDATGRTPLMLAAYVQPEEWGVGVARMLIEHDVRMDQRDKHGMNALHHACVYERVDLAQVLLKAPDFDLTQADRFGNTALHCAAMSGNPNLVKLLASYHHRYRHPLTKVNRQGRTAREEAVHAGHFFCAAILDDAISAPCRSKKADNQSDSESTVPVFVLREDSMVASEEAKPVFDEDTRMVEETKTAGSEESKLRLRRGDEEGCLFGTLDQLSQEGSNKHLLSPFHTPPTSDRSSDLKSRSQNPSPRTRRSGVRRAHPPAIRRTSIGSSNSTRSGITAQKLSLLSAQGSSNTASNNNVENGINEGQNNTENEAAEEQVPEVIQPPKSPGLQQPRSKSVLSENTTILNNSNNNNIYNSNNSEGVHSANAARPLLKSPATLSLRRESTFAARTPVQPLPYEKDPEQVIHVASEHDFRNSRDYVLKLTRMKFTPTHFDTDSLPVLVRRSPSLQREDDAKRKPSSAGSWRDNIRFLYRHLEYQCCPSWRDAALQPAEPLVMIPQWGVYSSPGDDGDETKEKKIRRPSSSNRPGSQMNDVSTSSNVKRKPSTNRQRKISSMSPPSGGGKGGEQSQGDNMTTSSSDSVSTASKKKLDTRPDLAPNRPQ